GKTCSLPNGTRTRPVTNDVVAHSRDQPHKRAHSTNAGTVTMTHGLPRRIAGNTRASLFLPHVWRRSRRSPSQRPRPRGHGSIGPAASDRQSALPLSIDAVPAAPCLLGS